MLERAGLVSKERRGREQLVRTFVDSDGTPIADMPVNKVRVRLAERGGGTRMEMHAAFESSEDMEKWVSMGTVEGLEKAVGKMDRLLG